MLIEDDLPTPLERAIEYVTKIRKEYKEKREWREELLMKHGPMLEDDVKNFISEKLDYGIWQIGHEIQTSRKTKDDIKNSITKKEGAH